MSSEAFAPALFFVGVLVLLTNECDPDHRAMVERRQAEVRAQREAPSPVWDERSDCYPGAPPNSLANALDPMKAHCDRAKAVGKLAVLAAAAAAPELAEVAIAEGAAAEGVLVRGAASAAVDAGAVGAAADMVAVGEGATEAAVTAAPRSYRLGSTSARTFSAEPANPSVGDGAYEVSKRSGGRYDVTSTVTGKTHPLSVRRVGDDVYEVEASDGSRSRVSGRQLDHWYKTDAHDSGTWEYEHR
jgi:hypothetical protein